jgi:hypothetical protein
MEINKLCCYCGINEATTKDHVPPKSIFNKPRPSDLITVPCCFQCNNAASISDEKFKAFLGMHVASQGGEAERLFKEGVLATVKHNNGLRHEILSSMYPVDIETKGGKGIAVPWNNEAHDETIERITRGLFFYHYATAIPSHIKMTVYWFSQTPEGWTDDMLDENSIANGLFKYKYRKVEDGTFDSIWLYNFYGGHFAGSIILD